MINNLEVILKEIKWQKKFYDIQEKNNDDKFNIFTICGVNHYENTHSSIIAEFLNPKGSHNLKDLFLRTFIETLVFYKCLDADFNFDTKEANVITEYPIPGGRIDIVIKSKNNKVLLIENKIYAKDQYLQLKTYYDFALINYGDNFKLLYLTLKGDDSSDTLGKTVPYIKVSYMEIIQYWIQRGIELTAKKPLVRETLIQYGNHIANLTNTKKNNFMNKDLLEMLIKPENVGSVFSLVEGISDVQNHIINEVFIPQFKELCNKYNLEFSSGESDFVSKPYNGFYALNKEWKNYSIFIEFQSSGLSNCVIGLGLIDIQDSDRSAHESLKNLFRYKNQRNLFDTFPKYPNWNGKAMQAIVDGDMKKELDNYFEQMFNKLKSIEGL